MSLLNIQFEPEVFEIAVFTRMRKAYGDNRICFIRVLAWQDLKSGEGHEQDTTLITLSENVNDLNKERMIGMRNMKLAQMN